jgi:hypothetical protein
MEATNEVQVRLQKAADCFNEIEAMPEVQARRERAKNHKITAGKIIATEIRPQFANTAACLIHLAYIGIGRSYYFQLLKIAKCEDPETEAERQLDQTRDRVRKHREQQQSVTELPVTDAEEPAKEPEYFDLCEERVWQAVILLTPEAQQRLYDRLTGLLDRRMVA